MEVELAGSSFELPFFVEQGESESRGYEVACALCSLFARQQGALRIAHPRPNLRELLGEIGHCLSSDALQERSVFRDCRFPPRNSHYWADLTAAQAAERFFLQVRVHKGNKLQFSVLWGVEQGQCERAALVAGCDRESLDGGDAIAQRRMRIVGINFAFLDLLPDAFRHLSGDLRDHKKPRSHQR